MKKFDPQYNCANQQFRDSLNLWDPKININSTNDWLKSIKKLRDKKGIMIKSIENSSIWNRRNPFVFPIQDPKEDYLTYFRDNLHNLWDHGSGVLSDSKNHHILWDFKV